jgi:tetratricopeptide (TPR) repeat protein
MSIPILPVFVSSTSIDLQPEREAVHDAVLRMKETQFVGMEHFGSRDENTRDASLDEVDRSRVYVGIIAGRYGSGITEAEYRRARARGLPCFIYFKADATIPPEWCKNDPAQLAKLNALKQELRANHIVGPDFVNPHDLAAKVTADLHNWLFKEYLTPILERAARGEGSSAQAHALLSGIKDMSALSPTLRAQLTARYQLRAPVGDFVGREKEIADLTAALRGGGSAAITGISGMGGIGKTELSLYVADRLRDAYPDAQLVLDMRGMDDLPRAPADAFASCIRAFVGLEQRLPDDIGELTRLYRSVLEGKRALILLDNASNSAQVRPLLPPAGSALLITSRNTITLPGMKTRVTLDQLQPYEARELLTGIAPRVPADVADQICFLCGYLPLAIRAAGSLLDVTVDLEPADYAARLRDERTRLERIGTEGVDVGVETSFNLSYARLDPEAARVFRQLAVFPASFEAVVEEFACNDTDHKHLSDLVRLSLVIYDRNAENYRLHDLARVFAGARLSEEEREAASRNHAIHFHAVLRAANDLYVREQNVDTAWFLLNYYWTDISAGRSWAESRAENDEDAAGMAVAYPLDGARLLYLKHDPRESIEWLNTAAKIAHRWNWPFAEGAALDNLGLAHLDAGQKREAAGYFDRALSIVREIKHRAGEGATLGNLGAAYSALGELRKAIEYYEQALTITRESKDRAGEGITLGNLGAAYAGLGETNKAIEFYDQALMILQETIDPFLANVLRLKALALNTTGDRPQAIAYAEAALEIYEQFKSPGAEKVRATLAQWRGAA